MKHRAISWVFLFLVFLFTSFTTRGQTVWGGSALEWPKGLPVYAHVVIVVEENKDYDAIVGNPLAPYINTVLKAEGAHFSQMYAEEHPSQGNYFWLFSGGNQNVGFKNKVPGFWTSNHPFLTPNLASQLIQQGLTFKGYSESLPEIGSTVKMARDKTGTWVYVRKHVPWISFGNVPKGSTVKTSSHLRFTDFPSDFNTLPTISFVIPNQNNNMHNGRPKDSIPAGDQWLRENLNSYYQWAKKNNSLLILTFDEAKSRRGHRGLTDPFIEIPGGQSCTMKDRSLKVKAACEKVNRILTIFAGAHIKPGAYKEGKGITHVNILRTLEAMYGLPRAGAQQPNALRGGIRDDFIITDVFK